MLLKREKMNIPVTDGSHVTKIFNILTCQNNIFELRHCDSCCLPSTCSFLCGAQSVEILHSAGLIKGSWHGGGLVWIIQRKQGRVSAELFFFCSN